MKSLHLPLAVQSGILALSLASPLAADIVISQYYEGASSDKWIEIQNTGVSTVTLSGYTLTSWSNANTEAWKTDGGTPTNSLDLSTLTLPAGAHFLVGNASAALPSYAEADVTSAVTFFNGDDSVVLYNGSVGTFANVVDAVSFTDIGNEGGNTSFHRIGSGVGFNSTLGSTVLDFPAVWEEKTPAEVDAAVDTDGFYLQNLGTIGTLSISIDISSVSESAGFGVATLTVGRVGGTDGELTISVSGDDDSEAQVESTEVILDDGDASDTVGIDAFDDLWLDGTQTVTFTASAPGFDPVTVTLDVTDDLSDTNSLVVNEVYYAVNVDILDANGDGVVNTNNPVLDEFIEVVNVTAGPLDVSGFSLEDTFGEIHLFPQGSVIPTGGAILVFAGGDIPDGSSTSFGTTPVQLSTNGGLFLNDDGTDVITVRDFSFNEIYSLPLPDQTGDPTGGSYTLSTDGDPTSGYVLHTTTPGASDFSPGTKVDGTPFFTITDALALTSNFPIAPETNVTVTDAITITIPSSLGADLEVSLTSSDETELFVPETVTIPMGSTSIDVTIDTVDDVLPDGDVAVTITASAPGYLNDDVVFTVQDDGDVLPDTPNLVFTEIMYNPASDESTPGVAEWVEIYNAGASSADLAGLIIDDEDSSDWGAIPGGILPAGEYAVIYDSEFTDESTFRSEWGVPSSALVIGVSWGSISNSPSLTSENLQLLDGFAQVIDEVILDDDGTIWPADDGAASVALLPAFQNSTDNDDGTNWILSDENSFSPTGPTFSTEDVGSPGQATPVGTGGDAYTSWASLNGLNVSNDGPEVDAENGGAGDGIANILEFILGGDPLASDTDILPTAAVDATDFIFTFERSDDSEGITTQTFQWSTDLSFSGANDVTIGAADSGPDGNGVTVTVVENGSDADTITVSVPVTNAPDGKLFGRLTGTRP